MSEFEQAVNFWPLAAIFGLFWGSFLNVLALRWGSKYRGLTLAERSHCPKCQKILNWHELLPLISLILLHGRCRGCRKKIDLRYPGVEILTAVFLGGIVFKYGLSAQALTLSVAGSLLLIAALVDFETQILPDSLVASAFVLTLLVTLLLGQSALVNLAFPVSSWWRGALTGGLIIGAIFLLTRGKGIGFGDVKLATVLGSVVGMSGALLMLWSAFILGSLVGGTLLLRRRATLKTALPFGPFLFAGWLIALFWGRDIIAWYTQL
ncbi:prepilin peptidase [Candidatus Berkelbacteria bacterium]|nr:prepilin peptidase [Candidatus Berkelbacteria bacterium]